LAKRSGARANLAWNIAQHRAGLFIDGNCVRVAGHEKAMVWRIRCDVIPTAVSTNMKCIEKLPVGLGGGWKDAGCKSHQNLRQQIRDFAHVASPYSSLEIFRFTTDPARQDPAVGLRPRALVLIVVDETLTVP
jgi:hypothetical protein